jgi:glycosyltransferase involved in cell wall biosynthesis
VKVLLPAFHCGPGQGSELGVAWFWATALRDAGHDVTVVTGTPFRPYILATGVQDIDFHFVDLRESPLSRFAKPMGIYYDTYLRWQDDVYKYLAARSDSYDIVHHVTWGSLHLGSRTWRLPAPLIYGPIGGGQTAPAGYRRYFGRGWAMEAVRTAATGSLLKLNGRSRETLRNAAVTLVTNSDTGVAARRMGATDVRYMLAEGLPDDWLGEARQPPAGPPVVLWVGRMLPRKAPTLSVEAFAELRRVLPARLVMVGDGPMMPQVRQAVARLGLADNVELLGRVPWAEVKQLYDSASVLLFPSLRDSSGMQFLEALGRGLPAVALDHHGIADLDVGPAAIKVPLPQVPAELPGDLAAALRQILTGDDWELRSGAAVKWAAEHVWSAKAAAATELYKDVAGRAALPA